MHVVVHLSDADRADRAFGNAANLLESPDVESVALVANGDGVAAYRDGGQQADRLGELVDAGLAARACANSLERERIQPGSLNRYVEIVPSGVVHVAELQDQGWAYVKA